MSQERYADVTATSVFRIRQILRNISIETESTQDATQNPKPTFPKASEGLPRRRGLTPFSQIHELSRYRHQPSASIGQKPSHTLSGVTQKPKPARHSNCRLPRRHRDERGKSKIGVTCQYPEGCMGSGATWRGSASGRQCCHIYSR